MMVETRTSLTRRPWWQRPGCILSIVVPVVLLVVVIWLYLSLYQGRDLSRVTGVPIRIALPDCVTNPDQVISVSFHAKSSGEQGKGSGKGSGNGNDHGSQHDQESGD